MARYAYTFDDGSEEEFDWDGPEEPDEETARKLAEQKRALKKSVTVREGFNEGDIFHLPPKERLEADLSRSFLEGGGFQTPRVEIPEEKILPTPEEAEEEVGRRAYQGVSDFRDTANEFGDIAIGSALGALGGKALPALRGEYKGSELISGAVPEAYRGWNELAKRFDLPDIDNPENPRNPFLGLPVGVGKIAGEMAGMPADLAAIAGLSAIPGAAPVIGAGFTAMMGAGALEKGEEAYQNWAEGKPWGVEAGEAVGLALPVAFHARKMLAPKVTGLEAPPEIVAGREYTPRLRSLEELMAERVNPGMRDVPESFGPFEVSQPTPSTREIPNVNLAPSEFRIPQPTPKYRELPNIRISPGGPELDPGVYENRVVRPAGPNRFDPFDIGTKEDIAAYDQARREIIEEAKGFTGPISEQEARVVENPNPPLQFTDTSFLWEDAQKNYPKKGKAVARELLQNSVDGILNRFGIVDPTKGSPGNVSILVDGNIITIKDNGSGMSPRMLTHDFNNAAAIQDESMPDGKYFRPGGSGPEKRMGGGMTGGKGRAKLVLFDTPMHIVRTTHIDPTTGRPETSVLHMDADTYTKLASGTVNVYPDEVRAPKPGEDVGTEVSYKLEDPLKSTSEATKDVRDFFEAQAKYGNLRSRGINFEATIKNADGSSNTYVEDPSYTQNPIHEDIIDKPAYKITVKTYDIKDAPTQFKVIRMNNGQVQNIETDYYSGVTSGKDLPTTFVLDVESKVLPKDPRYPWDPARERFTWSTQSDVRTWVEEMVRQTDAKKNNQAKYVWDRTFEIPMTGHVMYDSTGQVPDALMQRIASSKYMPMLTQTIHTLINDSKRLLSSWENNPVFEQQTYNGPGWSPKWYGINISGDKLPTPRRFRHIIINPWVHANRAISDWPVLNQKMTFAHRFAAKMWATIVHETLHAKYFHDMLDPNDSTFAGLVDDTIASMGDPIKRVSRLRRLFESTDNEKEILKDADDLYQLGQSRDIDVLGSLGSPSQIGGGNKLGMGGNVPKGGIGGGGESIGTGGGTGGPKISRFDNVADPVIRNRLNELDAVIRNPSTSPERKKLDQALIDKLLKEHEDKISVNIIPPKTPTVQTPRETKPQVILDQLDQQDWARDKSLEIKQAYDKAQKLLDKQFSDGYIDEREYAGAIEQLMTRRDRLNEQLAREIKKYTWSRPKSGGRGGGKPPGWVPGKEGESLSPGSMENWEREIVAGAFFRALRTSGDLSAPLRQGIWFLPSHPVQWWNAFVEMHKGALSERKYKEIDEKIRTGPTYQLAQMSGLHLARGPGELDPKLREEFYESSWAEESLGPISKFVIKPSERGYITFLNQLRMNMFKQYSDRLLKGQTGSVDTLFKKNYKAFSALSNYINVATGRGDLGRWEENAQGLAFALFAPRFISARAEMLGIPIGQAEFRAKNRLGKTVPAVPKEWGKSSGWSKAEYKERKEDFLDEIAAGGREPGLKGFLNRQVNKQFWVRTLRRLPNDLRAQVLGDIAKDIGALVGIHSLVTATGVAEMETDPRSSEFLKLKVNRGGKTRHYDLLGGFRPLIEIMAVGLTGTKKTAKGEVKNLIFPKYGSGTTWDQLARFGRSKLAPLPQVGLNYYLGKDFLDRPVVTPRILAGQIEKPSDYSMLDETLGQVEELGVPMSWSDVTEAYRGAGLPGALETSIPALYGAGVQTYDPEELGEELKMLQKMFTRRRVRRNF